MALIPCPECGRQISTLASSCPSCGCPTGGPAAKQATQGLAVAVPNQRVAVLPDDIRVGLNGLNALQFSRTPDGEGRLKIELRILPEPGSVLPDDLEPELASLGFTGDKYQGRKDLARIELAINVKRKSAC